jgi:hypothetical protein
MYIKYSPQGKQHELVTILQDLAAGNSVDAFLNQDNNQKLQDERRAFVKDIVHWQKAQKYDGGRYYPMSDSCRGNVGGCKRHSYAR